MRRSVAIDDFHAAVNAAVSAAVPPPPGLGDMVAAGLSAIGITKERISKALGGDCGCAKRQAKLNNLGRKFGIG